MTTTERPIERPARIALYAAGGAPYHHAAVFARAGHDVGFIYPIDILNGALSGFDGFVMPGGGYKWMQGQIASLGEDGTAAVKQYVSEGGMYLGSCAGAYNAAATPDIFLQICPTQENMRLLDACIWNASGWPGLTSPGVGVIQVRNANRDHPVMRDMSEVFQMTHYNGPLFDGAESLAVVDGYTERFTPAEHFLGVASQSLLIDDAAELQISNIVAGELGKGRVVLFGSHPEFGFSLAMDDAQPAAQLLINAIGWQLEASDVAERPRMTLAVDQWQGGKAELVTRAHELAAELRRQCDSLRARDNVDARWLRPDRALSIFGLAPDVIWSQSLDEIERRTVTVEQQVEDLDARTLGFKPPQEWNVDFGYYGVIPLLEQASRMLAKAARSWKVDIPFSDDAYAHLEDSPYHLVAGSYLAAVGRLIAADVVCAIGRRTSTGELTPIQA
jgi:hypothetical protein